MTQLIDARESDLDTSVFYKTSDMEAYAERTFSSLLYLTLEVLGNSTYIEHIYMASIVLFLTVLFPRPFLLFFFHHSISPDIHNVQADHAASHIGKAEGIVTLLRAAAYHRAKRNVFIPMDIIARVSHTFNSMATVLFLIAWCQSRRYPSW